MACRLAYLVSSLLCRWSGAPRSWGDLWTWPSGWFAQVACWSKDGPLGFSLMRYPVELRLSHELHGCSRSPTRWKRGLSTAGRWSDLATQLSNPLIALVSPHCIWVVNQDQTWMFLVKLVWLHSIEPGYRSHFLDLSSKLEELWRFMVNQWFP